MIDSPSRARANPDTAAEDQTLKIRALSPLYEGPGVLDGAATAGAAVGFSVGRSPKIT
jgi:hypothetical protein